MLFGKIGAFLLFLAAVFILGNLWFLLVEAVRKWIKKILTRGKKPPAWHPFPTDQEDDRQV